MKKIYFLIAILFLFFSCKKKDQVIDLSNCHDNYTTEYIPSVINLDTNCISIESVYESDIEYRFPKFNPVDANEIAYVKFNRTTYKGELWILNFCSGSHIKLTNQAVRKFDWSIRNWIVITNEFGEIWKVKSNGKELTKIGSNGFTEILVWNSDGTKMIFETPPIFSFVSEKKIYDEDGNLLENLNELEFEFLTHLDWKKNLLCYSVWDKLKIYDLQTREFTVIDSFIHVPSSNLNFSFSQFFDNENIYWVQSEIQIFTTNINSGERSLIKDISPDIFYKNFDISIDKKTMLIQKTENFAIDECSAIIKNSLVLMNTDGTNERKILIPE